MWRGQWILSVTLATGHGTEQRLVETNGRKEAPPWRLTTELPQVEDASLL